MNEQILTAFNLVLSTPLYKAGLFIIISISVAKISDIVFTSLLRRITRKTKTSMDDYIIDNIHKPIYYSILFIGFGLSISLLELPDLFKYISKGLMKTAVIFIWVSAIFKCFLYIFKWYSEKVGMNTKHQKRLLPLFDNLGKIIIFAGAVYFILLSWDINVTGLVASFGIGGFIVAFAAQDTIANLFAGIFIMADSPYKEGDYINLSTGERGYVKSIGLRSTRIMTRDDIEITIPNAVIANSQIINESGGPEEMERIRVNVSVAYGTDIKFVKSILLDIAKNAKEACSEPAARVRFRELGDSGLLFQLLFWIEKPEMRGRVIDDVNSAIYSRFMDEKIEIPYPQQTIHLKKSLNE